MDVKDYATEVVKTLVNAGHVAYFAGGWVRDFLMEHPSSDIDIATDARPEQILDLFPRTILVGLAFGVVVVVVDGHQFEVATFREDLEYVHGRRPEKIAYTNALEDAKRRDFTINGMFYDPLKDRIMDYVHGAEDIKLGVIRAIGDPQERFVEDRLRMIRAVRFAARFGFAIEPQTEQAIVENAGTLFPAVAIERVWQELDKMAKAPRLDQAIIMMHRFGLLQEIFPDLKQVPLHEIKDRVAHLPEACPTILSLLQLFPKVSEDDIRELCEYLKVSNQTLNLAKHYIKCQRLVHEGDKTEWVHFYAEPDAGICLEVVASRSTDPDSFLKEHQKCQKMLHKHIERVKTRKPLVTSAQLSEQGVIPGPMMGKLLREAETAVIENDLEDASEAIGLLKKRTPSCFNG